MYVPPLFLYVLSKLHYYYGVPILSCTTVQRIKVSYLGGQFIFNLTQEIF